MRKECHYKKVMGMNLLGTSKSCCILGHNMLRFSFGYDEESYKALTLKLVIFSEIKTLIEKGVKAFYVEVDPGIGLQSIELINDAAKVFDIELYAIMPYEEVANKWTPELRNRLFSVLEHCTDVITLERNSSIDAYEATFVYSIFNSDMTLAVYDPASARGDSVDLAIEYAKDTGKNIMLIHPDTFKISCYA